MEHKVYTGMHFRGSKTVPFGKCRCGAYLEGQAAIDEHRLRAALGLLDGAEKKNSGSNDA